MDDYSNILDYLEPRYSSGLQMAKDGTEEAKNETEEDETEEDAEEEADAPESETASIATSCCSGCACCDPEFYDTSDEPFPRERLEPIRQILLFIYQDIAERQTHLTKEGLMTRLEMAYRLRDFDLIAICSNFLSPADIDQIKDLGLVRAVKGCQALKRFFDYHTEQGGKIDKLLYEPPHGLMAKRAVGACLEGRNG